uniref:Ionotropic glutamate receptor C-terminal domain-containing protein n=1 Tax=Musca domestica TaxID=7370 RepID=A0A1I8MXQ4_MUSDO
MDSWAKVVVILLAIKATVNGIPFEKFHLDKDSNGHFYEEILKEIENEKVIESLLVLQENIAMDVSLRIFHESPIPKVIISKNQNFQFMEKFNTQLLTIFLMAEKFNPELLAMGARILDYQRQTRIFIVARKIAKYQGEEAFKNELLKDLENYKMTSVLLCFEEDKRLYVLKAYPKYHWLEKNLEDKYYPPYWQNLQNKTLITLNGQDPPTGLVYLDNEGRLQMNGYMARLIMLFAERFNASLQLHKSFKFGKSTAFRDINDFSFRGELDIPMSLAYQADPTYPQNLKTMYYEIIKPLMMVPCPTQLTYRELFGLLLNEKFLGLLIACYLQLSLIHCCIDYFFDHFWNPIDFVVNDKIFPGLLGQSFVTRTSSCRILRIIYLLLSLIGIYITVLFGANIKTLFTQPPYHKYIETNEDLKESPTKIFSDPTYAVDLLAFYNQDSVVVAPNDAEYLKQKSKFNNSYAYIISSTEWEALFSRRQQFYTKKQFCIAYKINLQDFLLYSMVLPKNSPYREPLNEHIMRVQELGFMEAWQSSTFVDMLRLGNISLFGGYDIVGDKKILSADDLFWIWMIIVVGAVMGILAFGCELYLGKRSKSRCIRKNKKNRK